MGDGRGVVWRGEWTGSLLDQIGNQEKIDKCGEETLPKDSWGGKKTVLRGRSCWGRTELEFKVGGKRLGAMMGCWRGGVLGVSCGTLLGWSVGKVCVMFD